MEQPSDNPRSVVRAGYDTLGPRYLEWTLSVDPLHRETYLALVLDRLTSGSLVVELGCGPGVPTGQQVAAHHRYVGVDVSATQLALARGNVPAGCFVLADMSQVAFRTACLDAALAFYSLIHVPRDDYAAVLRSVHSWLRPGGVLALNLGAADDPGGDDAWIDGVPMYWSSWGAAAGVKLVRDAGFDILGDEVLTNFEDARDVRFLWVLARKGPVAAAGAGASRRR